MSATGGEGQGRVVVITGAGGGIGAAAARVLAARGYRLALIEARPEPLAAIAKDLGGAVLWSEAVDVRSSAALAGVAESLRARGLGVDVLVNNAAVYAQGPLLELREGDFEWCVEVNLLGLVRCCRAFAPLMAGRPGAQIVNVLSEFAWLPFPNKASYCATKAGAAMVSACLRSELQGRIRVTDFVPPAVDTGLVRDARAASGDARQREAKVLADHARPVDEVARALARVIARPRDRAVCGLMPRFAILAARLAPGITRRAAARAARKLGLA